MPREPSPTKGCVANSPASETLLLAMIQHTFTYDASSSSVVPGVPREHVHSHMLVMVGEVSHCALRIPTAPPGLLEKALDARGRLEKKHAKEGDGWREFKIEGSGNSKLTTTGMFLAVCKVITYSSGACQIRHSHRGQSKQLQPPTTRSRLHHHNACR